MLLLRHAELVLEKLSKHPQRNLPENKSPLKLARDSVRLDLQKLEDLRPRIEKRYAEYQERRKAQVKALEALEGRGADVRNIAHELDGLSLQHGHNQRLSYEKATLDAGENRSLAAKLAQREFRRRDAARRSVRQAGVSEEQEQERRTGGVWGDWETDYKRDSGEVDDNDLSRQIQEVARLQNGHGSTTNFSVSIWYYFLDKTRSLIVVAPYVFPSSFTVPLPFSAAQERPATMVWHRALYPTKRAPTTPARHYPPSPSSPT